jgi:hypothetical protein
MLWPVDAAAVKAMASGSQHSVRAARVGMPILTQHADHLMGESSEDVFPAVCLFGQHEAGTKRQSQAQRLNSACLSGVMGAGADSETTAFPGDPKAEGPSRSNFSECWLAPRLDGVARTPETRGHGCRGHARVPQACVCYHTLWREDIYERYRGVVGSRPLQRVGSAKVGTIARREASNPQKR